MKESERGKVFLEWEEVRFGFLHYEGRLLGLNDLRSRHWEVSSTSTTVIRKLTRWLCFRTLSLSCSPRFMGKRGRYVHKAAVHQVSNCASLA